MLERYTKIKGHFPREMVLLQGMGCRWRRCTFCDYHEDVSGDPFEVNRPILEQITGEFGVLDVINSGSCLELDEQTLLLLAQVVRDRKIRTLWFEAHYMYRFRLAEFAARFPSVEVKFRCGVESFDPTLRAKWNKGIPAEVTPEEIARWFCGVCLLCCTQGETRERIERDIAIAREKFEYASVNLFCNNHTAVRRDEELATWFLRDLYPQLKEDPRLEILLNNTDLGVG